MSAATNTAFNIAALALFVVYLLLGFVVRTWLQWRRTGDGGFRGISGRPGSPEWVAGVAFVVALVAGILGPVVALAGLEPMALLDVAVVRWAGAVLAVTGLVGTLAVQLQMGTSWRIGVDEAERTDLVTDGAFSLVRNPIFTAMAFTGAGLALMTPNLVASAGFVALLLALELQVRVVEYARRPLPGVRRGDGTVHAQGGSTGPPERPPGSLTGSPGRAPPGGFVIPEQG